MKVLRTAQFSRFLSSLSKNKSKLYSKLLQMILKLKALELTSRHYLKKYTEEKMKYGFRFIQNKTKSIHVQIELKNKKEMQDFQRIIQNHTKDINILICKSGVIVDGKEVMTMKEPLGEIIVSFPETLYELKEQLEKCE